MDRETEKIIEAIQAIQKQGPARRPTKQKMSFSKKALIAVFVMGFVMFGYTLVYTGITKDSSPLGYLIPSVFGAFAVAVGFFLKKAEKENQMKIEKGDWSHED